MGVIDMKDIKTFGDVKPGDEIYFIEYTKIPSIVTVHAYLVEYPSADTVTITILEKVPNTTEGEKEFKIDNVETYTSCTFYNAFTTMEQAKSSLYDMLSDKIEEAYGEIGKATIKIEDYKNLIKVLQEEREKYAD